jgi:hypothetical protein
LRIGEELLVEPGVEVSDTSVTTVGQLVSSRLTARFPRPPAIAGSSAKRSVSLPGRQIYPPGFDEYWELHR